MSQIHKCDFPFRTAAGADGYWKQSAHPLPLPPCSRSCAASPCERGSEDAEPDVHGGLCWVSRAGGTALALALPPCPFGITEGQRARLGARA